MSLYINTILQLRIQYLNSVDLRHFRIHYRKMWLIALCIMLRLPLNLCPKPILDNLNIVLPRCLEMFDELKKSYAGEFLGIKTLHASAPSANYPLCFSWIILEFILRYNAIIQSRSRDPATHLVEILIFYSIMIRKDKIQKEKNAHLCKWKNYQKILRNKQE